MSLFQQPVRGRLAPRRGLLSLLLYGFEVIDELPDAAARQVNPASRPLRVLAGPKPIAPDRHVPAAVESHVFAAVDDAVRPPEGKLAPVLPGEPGKVRRLALQPLGHVAVALAARPVAARAVPLILQPPAGKDFFFLRPSAPSPRQKNRRRSHHHEGSSHRAAPGLIFAAI